MNNRTIIQLIIVFASLVLGMILYPILLRKWRQFVDWLYQITYGKDEMQKPEKIEKVKAKTYEKASIIGESKTIIGHGRTKADTASKNENPIEKESTFAPESKEDNPPMDNIEAPLEKIESLSEDEFDGEAEQEELETEPDAVCASGASYDDLMKTGEVIGKEESTEQEKDLAGKVLYENRSTEMVETMATTDELRLEKINSIIHLHMKKHNLNVEVDSDSDEFNGFDFNSIF